MLQVIINFKDERSNIYNNVIECKTAAENNNLLMVVYRPNEAVKPVMLLIPFDSIKYVAVTEVES